jgi:hypothetical protein
VVVARLASKDEGKRWWALSMLVFEVAIVLLHLSIYFLARVGNRMVGVVALANCSTG